MVKGKIIISGEHSVVYGALAIAASVGMSVSAKVVEKGGSEKNEIVEKAIMFAGGNNDTEVLIDSQIPIGSGMGSSAAVSAAVIRAVREGMSKPIIRKEELYDLVMECEKVAHGNPSGIDAATVVYGGIIAFTKGKPIEQLQIHNPIKVILINTGRPVESTKEMVELVSTKKNKDKVLSEIGLITKEIKRKLVEGEKADELIDKNGLLLEDLGVVGESARSLSAKLRSFGCGVKVAGAGGFKSGSGMLLVTAPDLAKIASKLDDMKIDYIKTELGQI